MMVQQAALHTQRTGTAAHDCSDALYLWRLDLRMRFRELCDHHYHALTLLMAVHHSTMRCHCASSTEQTVQMISRAMVDPDQPMLLLGHNRTTRRKSGDFGGGWPLCGVAGRTQQHDSFSVCLTFS
jgi:hypothetical protein